MTLAKGLAEVKAEENGEKLMDVTTDSIVEALANTLAVVEAEKTKDWAMVGRGTGRHACSHANRETLGRTQWLTLARVKIERVGETLNRVEAEPLVHTEADTLQYVEAEI